MRTGFISVVAFFAFLMARAQPEGHGLTITHLTGGFYVYTTYHKAGSVVTPSNSMYLVTGKHVVLFDTPWDPDQFQPLLDSIESRHHQPVIGCIVTHYHDDRIAGLPYYRGKGIPIWSSQLTFQLSIEKELPPADHVFTSDTTFMIDDYTFQTYYPGPGHTEDNIVVWFPSDKVLYAGCLVKSTDYKALGQIPDADIKGWSEAVRKLIRKYPDVQYVIPGHYSWADKNSLQHTIDLVRRKKREK